VTQEGPAGTSNRCVMLPQGYLEFLTPTADTPNAQRMRKSMRRYRGVHLVCFGTPVAEDEHARLQEHGFAPQPLVRLERQVEDGMTVRFFVVRAAAGKMPEGRVQYVQHLVPEATSSTAMAWSASPPPMSSPRTLCALPRGGRASWARCRGVKASSFRSKQTAARC